MKRLLLILLALSSPAWSATTLFLYSTGTSLTTRWSTASVGYGCNNSTAEIQAKRMTTAAQGISVVSITHTPTATAPPCQMGNSTAYYRWVSDPIATGSIASTDTIGAILSCNESNSSTNAGMQFKLYRWNVQTGGIEKLIHASGVSAECAGARYTITGATPSSASTTSFNVGDRLIAVVEMMNVGTWGGNSARTVTLAVGVASGTYGDSQLTLSSTLTFGTDANNGRKMMQ